MKGLPLVFPLLLCSCHEQGAKAFEIPNLFGATKPPTPSSSSKTKEALLQAVSGTNNGKSATPAQQRIVLDLVRQLETTWPAPDTILTSDADLIDGTWYLQYTSPSNIGDEDQFPDAWKPVNAAEGDTQIETNVFGGQGAVSAQGIRVETANRVVQQRIDTANARVTNEIALDWGDVVVAGRFRQSPTVPNRAIVAFDQADLVVTALNNLKISLGWFFAVTAAIRGVPDNGWLETTYIDEDMRIGRGNKGTMFCLTRDPHAVSP